MRQRLSAAPAGLPQKGDAGRPFLHAAARPQNEEPGHGTGGKQTEKTPARGLVQLSCRLPARQGSRVRRRPF